MAKGIIKEVSQVFSSGNPIPSRWGNLEQEDGVLLSDALVNHHARYHNAAIHTLDFKMPHTAGADIVTLAAGTYFTVGGVLFSTDDLTSRELTIPDNSTRYAYLQVADDCGAIVDWNASPLVRKKTVSLTLEDTEQATTPAKLLVLKAVKGASGTVPTVTAYANTGGWGSFRMGVLVYDASGTFEQGVDVPSDVRYILARGWAAGGAGGSGAAFGGGAAGGFFEIGVALDLGETIPITIGEGGVPTALAGGDGGDTSLGSYATAYGGEGAPADGSMAEGGDAVGGDVNIKGGDAQTYTNGSQGGDAPCGGLHGQRIDDSAAVTEGGTPGGGGGTSGTGAGSAGGDGRITIYYVTREAA